MTVTKPLPFQGTEETKKTNFQTHYFAGIDGRCYDCDTRPYSVSSFYPCGETVLRVAA